MKVQPISYKQVKEKFLQDEETKQLYLAENFLFNLDNINIAEYEFTAEEIGQLLLASIRQIKSGECSEHCCVNFICELNTVECI